MTSKFVRGIDLCRDFYWQAVRPVLDADFPNVEHSAALIGPGSEVLGFDTAMSSDHHWGPRAMLFLSADDLAAHGDALTESFRWKLPRTFGGYPTGFAQPTDEDPGTRMLQETSEGPIDHRVELFVLRDFVLDYLGFDIGSPPDAEISAAQWLSFPQQKLRTLVEGTIYHDGIGLAPTLEQFRYYPRDPWLFSMAGVWTSIGQEEHLMGRAGSAADELGSALIAARLVSAAMKLRFLQERRYAPYAKWFGTAFAQLDGSKELGPLLEAVMAARTWQERDRTLGFVYAYLARKHAQLGLTHGTLPTEQTKFWNRPFTVIHGERFAQALVAEIRNEGLRKLCDRGLIGSIDCVTDSTEVLEKTPRDTIARLYVS